ncbi:MULTISPECIES: hypothetical protein [unclassified Microcoleus]|uniref:hypothetical protein n=1 Tax=unclassified Microcoleus TaxID=2642155 RepID=UPI002FD3F85D
MLAEVEATVITPKKDYPIDCCREQSPIAIGSLHKKQEWVVAIAMFRDIFILLKKLTAEFLKLMVRSLLQRPVRHKRSLYSRNNSRPSTSAEH